MFTQDVAFKLLMKSVTVADSQNYSKNKNGNVWKQNIQVRSEITIIALVKQYLTLKPPSMAFCCV